MFCSAGILSDLLIQNILSCEKTTTTNKQTNTQQQQKTKTQKKTRTNNNNKNLSQINGNPYRDQEQLSDDHYLLKFSHRSVLASFSDALNGFYLWTGIFER